MNLDKILKVFVPKDHSFYPLFEKDAQNLIKAVEVLKQLMSTDDLELRENLCKQIKDYELKGDEITHSIYDQLNKTFITPFDREDIQWLTANIDDVLDAINSVSQKIKLYKPILYLPAYLEFTEILFQAAKEIDFSVKHLKETAANKDKIIQSCILINTLENKADDLYHETIPLLFENEKDPFELIKKKEILESLEKAADKAEDVADVINTILVKMA